MLSRLMNYDAVDAASAPGEWFVATLTHKDGAIWTCAHEHPTRLLAMRCARREEPYVTNPDRLIYAQVPEPPPFVPDVVDIGNDIMVEPMVAPGAPSTYRWPFHYLVFHYKGDTSLIVLDTPETEHLPQPRWDVESYASLTVSPSLNFKEWDLHGWLKGGVWKQ